MCMSVYKCVYKCKLLVMLLKKAAGQKLSTWQIAKVKPTAEQKDHKGSPGQFKELWILLP